jgi:hypothetical protein
MSLTDEIESLSIPRSLDEGIQASAEQATLRNLEVDVAEDLPDAANDHKG